MSKQKQDFEEMLNKTFDDLQDDKPLEGEFLLAARNAVYMAPRSEDGSAKVLVFYNPVEPMDDIATELVETFEEDYDFTENEVVHTVWLDKNRDWKGLKTFIAKHEGADMDGTIIDVIKKGLRGAQVVAELYPEEYENSFGELTTETRARAFRSPE